MESNRPNLFIFGWPSFVGGADTKLAHLLLLLHQRFLITVVPNENRHLHNTTWTKSLEKRGIKYAMLERLPPKLNGLGLSMCNDCFFVQRIAHRAKERGLKIIWSSEMMWHHQGELDAVKEGVIDKVLYTSEFQKCCLEPGYGNLPSIITGNYIDPSLFPFKKRQNVTFTIGRLSRPAWEKYPEDFPVFYEALKLPEVRFRVMAWNHQLKNKYRWHSFDHRWDLLKEEQESLLNSRIRKVDTLINITQQHRAIWLKFLEAPALKRINKSNLDLAKHPVTDEEMIFVNLIILHLATVLIAVRRGILPKPAGLDVDVADLFSLPIPRAVWGQTKAFRDPETIRYVDGLLT